MTKAAQEILERALALPAEERVKLAEKLFESIPEDTEDANGDELSPEWREEIERRVGDAVAHPERSVSAESILDELARRQQERSKARGKTASS